MAAQTARTRCDVMDESLLPVPRTVYHSRVDRWIWPVGAVVLSLLIVNAVYSPWHLAMIQTVGVLSWPIVMIFGVKYAIEGDELLVYQYFRCRRLPVAEIREVTYSRGYTNCVGLSRFRLTIDFRNNHDVLKSCLPLAISPVDRDAFVEQLLTINPDIEVVRNP